MPVYEQIMCRNIIEMIKEYLSDPKNLEEFTKYEEMEKRKNEAVHGQGNKDNTEGLNG